MTVLEPLSVHTLPLVEPWFDDEATRRHLGTRAWPARALELASGPLAVLGEDVVGRWVWIVREGPTAVALLDVERYADGTAGLALVVAPEERSRGVGRAAILAAVGREELAGVREVRCGIEADNVASRRCVSAIGFVEAGPGDTAGMATWVLRRR